jgi:hypothetical protein
MPSLCHGQLLLLAARAPADQIPKSPPAFIVENAKLIRCALNMPAV